ncbi:MAG: hypothetical protein HY319_08105 [Armatimonadetes bacterium]|nr:hypothetical protein [Armatimonadota bacterium]
MRLVPAYRREEGGAYKFECGFLKDRELTGLVLWGPHSDGSAYRDVLGRLQPEGVPAISQP